MPHYGKAHLTVETSGRTIEQVTEEIAERLELLASRSRG
jgi:DNA-binding ferritin-like protein